MKKMLIIVPIILILASAIPVKGFSPPSLPYYSNFQVPPPSPPAYEVHWTESQWQGWEIYNDLYPQGAYPPYWDEFESTIPSFTYWLTGTEYVVNSIVIQYPVFLWIWNPPDINSPDGIKWNWNTNDPRAAHYVKKGPTGDDTLFAVWDDGGERGWPSNGYFDVTLTFPEGCYELSLYAYDYENAAGQYQRTYQNIYVMDGNGNILAQAVMLGDELNFGVYVRFRVCVQTLTKIVVRVEKAPESVNAVLSGIFVDSIPACGPSPTVQFIGKDIETKGDWQDMYGSSAHILPYVPVRWTEVPVGGSGNPNPRTIGYWKNHLNVIRANWASWRDYVKSFSAFSILSDNPNIAAIQIYQILSGANAKDMKVMLKAQLLGMVLNIASGYVSKYALVYLGDVSGATSLFGYSSMTADNVVTTIDNNVFSSSPTWTSRSQQEIAKNVLDAMNNNRIFVG